MGAEDFVGVGTWTCLGWLLDAQRALARAPRAVARTWVFESRVESTRSALLRFNCAVLDRSPIIEHLSRVLHGSVSSAPARTADPVHYPSATGNSRMFCAVSSGRLNVAMDARGTTDCTGNRRLCLRDVSFRCATFGALSLYRSRADRGFCIQTRRWDRFFALTAGGVFVFFADILAGAVAYQDQWVDRWFPAWIVSAENGIRGGAMVALFAITAIMLVAELRTPRWSLPRILYIVGLAVMVGLALRPRSLFLFLVIWTSQHWILATGLASQTPSAESAPTAGVVRRFLHRLNVRPWAVVLFLMLLSLVFLPVFEV